MKVTGSVEEGALRVSLEDQDFDIFYSGVTVTAPVVEGAQKMVSGEDQDQMDVEKGVYIRKVKGEVK